MLGPLHMTPLHQVVCPASAVPCVPPPGPPQKAAERILAAEEAEASRTAQAEAEGGAQQQSGAGEKCQQFASPRV